MQLKRIYDNRVLMEFSTLKLAEALKHYDQGAVSLSFVFDELVKIFETLKQAVLHSSPDEKEKTIALAQEILTCVSSLLLPYLEKLGLSEEFLLALFENRADIPQGEWNEAVETKRKIVDCFQWIILFLADFSYLKMEIDRGSSPSVNPKKRRIVKRSDWKKT
jgi:hypothetical protein